MFSQPFLYLPFLFLATYGQEDTRLDPVDVLQVKHLLIQNYNGPLDYDTMKLFPNVADVHLAFSNFTTFNLSFLLAVPNMKRLLMFKNLIEPVDFNISGCCKQVEELELTNTRTGDLLDVELKMVKAMESLENLVIQNKEFPKLTANTLVSSNLLYLTIIGCKLAAIEENAFEKLDKLKTLDLKYNSIKEIKKEVLAPLKNVTTIDLKGNYLEKLTTDQFPPLPNLETLVVSYNPITNINLEGIKKIAPKLKMVDITGTFVEKTESGGIQLYKRNVVRLQS